MSFQKLADGMPGGFFIYHATGEEEIIYANEAMLRIFECGSLEEFRELTGNSFRGIVHPEDLEYVEESIREQISASRYDLDYVEYRILTRSGAVRWIDDYGHFVHSETAGDIFYVFVGDATEKKKRQAEEKERLLREKLELIEGLSIDYESLFHADLDADRIQAYRVSDRVAEQFCTGHEVCRFTGFDAEYIRKWVCPEDRAALAGVSDPAFIREKLSKDRKYEVNYRIQKDGKTEYIQLRVVNVGSGQEVSQIVMGYRDINDEIAQEVKQKQVLKEALDEANRANKAKNRFLSNMSHDIRTPMNAIVGFTALAKKHVEELEKASEYLDMISSAGDQLLQLLNDVLEISEIESGQTYVEEKKCRVTDILRQVQEFTHPRAAGKNIRVSVDIREPEHNVVMADQQKLVMILSCLADNAIKYTGPGGRVSIAAEERKSPREDYAVYRFRVEDNGIGIESEFLEHIFEPFERAQNTTMSGIYGTGLGLTIARGIVELMGGSIEASSAVGRGSVFTVTVPLRISVCPQAPAPLRKADAEEDPGAFAAEGIRILAVDDNQINLEIEEEVLKEAGYLVETAEDGSVAVEMVRHRDPGYYDLILMDIQMPGMDGHQATRVIRKMEDPQRADIPVIALSANNSEKDRKASVESGMNAHLAKPLDISLLYELLQKYLKNGGRE